MLCLLAAMMRGPGAPAAYSGDRACSLDGVDELLVGPSLTLSTSAGFGVSMWAKRNDSSGSEFFFHLRNSSSKALSIYSTALKITTTFASTTTIGGETTGNVLTAGQWAHIAVSVDKPSNHRLRLWVDGVLVQTWTGTLTDTSFASTFTVGRQFSPASIYLNGGVCDLAVWDASLTDANVEDMHNGGVRGDPEGLSGLTARALWAFRASDDMTGTTGSIADLKGGSPLVPTNTESGDLVVGPS